MEWRRQLGLKGRLPMHTTHSHPHMHHARMVAERAVIRSIIVASGAGLVVTGIALGASVVMLPVGVGIGLIGLGLTAWGAVGDLPLDD